MPSSHRHYRICGTARTAQTHAQALQRGKHEQHADMVAPMSPLEARDIHFCYTKEPVLAGISLCAQAGEMVGLVGPNGCGKTTLLKVTAGLLAGSGQVAYGGVALAELSARDKARRRAYVPQSTDAVLPFTVREIVAMGRAHLSRWYGIPEVGSEVEAALDEVGLGVPPQRTFTTLSGGERQQVLVARALVQDSTLLLLDEPVSALDLRHRLQVVRALRRRAHSGAAVLVSMHDLTLAAMACDRLVLLCRGRAAAVGKPSVVLQPETLERVYGVPVVCVPHPSTQTPTILLDPGARGL